MEDIVETLSLPQVSLPPHGAYGEACLRQHVSSKRKLAFNRQTELNLPTREVGRGEGGSWLNPGYRDHGNGVIKRRGDGERRQACNGPITP